MTETRLRARAVTRHHAALALMSDRPSAVDSAPTGEGGDSYSPAGVLIFVHTINFGRKTMPDTNNREFGSKDEHIRRGNARTAGDASESSHLDESKEILEKDLECVEEDRSSQRTRSGGGEQFTAPGGQGQQYKP
jgi:hypothetical protein